MAKPVFVGTTYNLDDSGASSGNILATAYDLDGDTLTVGRVDGGLVGGPKGELSFVGQYGTLLIANDGTYTYTPNPGLNLSPGMSLTEDFDIKIRDGSGLYAQAFIKFQINGTTNDRPIAVDDFATVSGVTANGNVLANDSDPDGDPLHVGGVISPGGLNFHITGEGPTAVDGLYGTLLITDNGSYTYLLDTSDADYIALGGAGATEVFSYKPHDGQNGEGNNTDFAHLTITIPPADTL